jgi:hypothetical protein
MRSQYIEFISAYCDRWCERCAFTDRCSAYAVEMAMSMCEGDIEAAIELAVGSPPPLNETQRKEREATLNGVVNCEPTRQEMAEFARQRQEQRERIDELSLTTVSEVTSLLVHRWLMDHREATGRNAEPVLADALAVASWDSHFIHVTLHRAMRGRDDTQHDREFGDDDPIQNDWNGSAKVALISIDRSIEAWDVIARATKDADAAHIAQELGRLRHEVEQGFPNARKFVRPGFDR